MELGQIVVLGVLAYSIYAGWSYSRGSARGVPLYAISLVVVASLLGAAAAQALELERTVEVLNVTAIALSLAALASSPGLWEEQIRTDLERTRLYQPIQPRDFLSWRGWLKLVDRLGAVRAALAYLGVFGVALLAELVAAALQRPRGEGPFLFIALLAPCLFGLLSTMWVFRGARRLIPGA